MAGITPACAGKTLFALGRRDKAVDHPRMCGKDDDSNITRVYGWGSPPHVRERLTDKWDDFARARITPACAGKTASLRIYAVRYGDHPRMCGKDQVESDKVKDRLGSPPHVRERQYFVLVLFSGRRITPACAGKTAIHMTRYRVNRDHPRMCGKDDINGSDIELATGSPPHVRERRLMEQENGSAYRITPACAGKTRPPTRCTSRHRDHPRMCGKDRSIVFHPDYGIGSPPHVRERLVCDGFNGRDAGITPACAGKTHRHQPNNTTFQDHPRMCGKDSDCYTNVKNVLGSPPHVRERQLKKDRSK